MKRLIWTNSRICQDPHKKVLIQETYINYANLCGDVALSINSKKVCSLTTPNQPPASNVNRLLDSLIHEYAVDNVAVINIYIKDPYYTSIKRDQGRPMS
jgi:hypothetical protein